MSPPRVNGCNLVTSVIKSVLGRNGSCTLHGRGLHMPFVVFLFSCLSRFFVQKIQFAAPMYFESHWVSGDVHNAFWRLHVRVVRSRFRSHHKPMFMLLLPLQRCEISEGGPPCKSMPLVRRGLTPLVLLVAWHSK